MRKYLENGFANEKIRTDLADKNAEFYFAELEVKVIGFLKINFGHSQT